MSKILSSSSYSYTQGKRIRFVRRTDLLAISFHPSASADTIQEFERANRAVIQPSSMFQEVQGSHLRIYRLAPIEGLKSAELARVLREQKEVIKVSDVYVYVNPQGHGLVLIDDLVAKVDIAPRQLILPYPTREVYPC
ncbi:MAG: hypothetical protein U0528_18205 [Anaerolineae bacterium]|nr:hypothetical protein [Anaerolineae bacterium]